MMRRGEEKENKEASKVEDYYGIPANLYTDASAICSAIHVELEDYLILWKPFRRAIIINVLGRNINFRILEF